MINIGQFCEKEPLTILALHVGSPIYGKHKLSGDACLNHKPGLWGSGRLAYSEFVVQGRAQFRNHISSYRYFTRG